MRNDEIPGTEMTEVTEIPGTETTEIDRKFNNIAQMACSYYNYFVNSHTGIYLMMRAQQMRTFVRCLHSKHSLTFILFLSKGEALLNLSG